MQQIGGILNNAVLAAFMLLAVWQDVRTRKIKNQLNVAGVLAGLVFAAVLPQRSILQALAGVGCMLAAGLLCWRIHIFRAGDAKLLCVAGAFLGWKMGLSCMLLSAVIGAVVGLPLLMVRVVKKEKGWTKFPFSVACALACGISVRFGYLWDILDRLAGH